MFEFLFNNPGKHRFDKRVLKKNNISLLILDERWNALFNDGAKPKIILKAEDKLRELLKEQARITSESESLNALKKQLMAKILELTPLAFDKGDGDARNKMSEYEAQIRQINEKVEEAKKRLEQIPDDIKQANIELLEHTVQQVYVKIASKRNRISQLEKLIEQTREKLKQYIDEKESLAQQSDEIYSYFHDLLGKEELEKLDRMYL